MIFSRRDLLAAPALLGANDRIRIGVIGCGGRGQYLVQLLSNAGGNEVVALCDVWDQQARAANRIAGGRSELYSDHRRLLDRKDVDAVVVATADHWHTPVLIDAVLAAKDAYVEKPMTHHPEEGVRAVEAVRKSGRIVQVGVQRRSSQSYLEAKQRYIESDRIGKVTMVRCIWDGNGWFRRGAAAGAPKPGGLDWDRFLGPAPKRAWDARRYFNWGAYRDYSVGQSGGVFSHLIDVAHWFLGDSKPRTAVASGGIYELNDGRDVPDTITLILEYAKGFSLSCHGTLASRNVSRTEIYGTGGTLSLGHRKYWFTPFDAAKPVEEHDVVPMDQGHMNNWLACVRSRTPPNADAASGHYTAVACHMGNMAYERRQAVSWSETWSV